MTRMQMELKQIGRLQQRLLPRALPQCPGWELAAHCGVAPTGGGDYYDLLPIGASHLGILIADVSGHGPAAAVLTAMIRMLMHSCPITSGHQREPFCPVKQDCLPSPHVVLTHLNRVLVENTLDDQFTTMVYGILSLHTGTLQFSVAGHMPPWWWQASTDKLATLPDIGGLPLGADAASCYESATVQMSPGDQLILYTDGMTDARDADGEMFGGARLEASICAHAREAPDALKSALMRRLREFLNESTVDDDQTLLILKRSVQADDCPSELFFG